MDHTIIKTNKLATLDKIAGLSAVQLLEFNEYIRLATYMETYVAHPTDMQFNKVQQQLALCVSSFPRLLQTRQDLVAMLLSTGKMKRRPKKQTPTNAATSADIISFERS